MKNAAVAEFILALATLAISGIILSGCGGDPACDNGSCDQGQTDAGTSGDNNPITDAGVEDAGVSDTGDKPDAGKADCSELRAKLQKEWTVIKSDCSLVGYTMTGKVEDAGDTCHETFNGACAKWSLKGTKLPLKETDESGITVTVELIEGNVLQATVDDGSIVSVVKFE